MQAKRALRLAQNAGVRRFYRDTRLRVSIEGFEEYKDVKGGKGEKKNIRDPQAKEKLVKNQHKT